MSFDALTIADNQRKDATFSALLEKGHFELDLTVTKRIFTIPVYTGSVTHNGYTRPFDNTQIHYQGWNPSWKLKASAGFFKEQLTMDYPADTITFEFSKDYSAFLIYVHEEQEDGTNASRVYYSPADSWQDWIDSEFKRS